MLTRLSELNPGADQGGGGPPPEDPEDGESIQRAEDGAG